MLPAILLLAMLNSGTIKPETYINVSLFLLMLTLAIPGCHGSLSVDQTLTIVMEVLTTIFFPYTRCTR